MDARDRSLLQRMEWLGLTCDELPTDRLSSALTALAAFPMYMVANCPAWTSGKRRHVPGINAPGAAMIRESFVIGEEEGRVEMERQHRHVLGTLLSVPKPSDRVIYEFALETLNLFLEAASPALADAVRTSIARTIVCVARASGEGFLGMGPLVSMEERACISHIATTLHLAATPDAVSALDAIDG